MKAALAIAMCTAAMAQTNGPEGFVPSQMLNRELPTWLRFSGEYRARLEGVDGLGFRDAIDRQPARFVGTVFGTADGVAARTLRAAGAGLSAPR